MLSTEVIFCLKDNDFTSFTFSPVAEHHVIPRGTQLHHQVGPSWKLKEKTRTDFYSSHDPGNIMMATLQEHGDIPPGHSRGSSEPA